MYKFSLETVLTYKKNIEKRHIQEMHELKQRLDENKKKLSQYVDEAGSIAKRLAEEEEAGIRPAEASIYRSSLKVARQRVADQKKEILSVEGLIEKKRLELTNASVEKKVVEKLKEKDRKKYLMELSRANQKKMDEIASMRHVKR